MQPSDGTRWRRRHETRRSVRVAETVSRSLITGGGLGTILAVCGVFVFLVWTVADLFDVADVTERAPLAALGDRSVADAPGAGAPVAVGTDEYGLAGWTVAANGVYEIASLSDGESLLAGRLADEGAPLITTVQSTADGRRFVAGRADGSLILFSLRFDTRYREADEVSKELRSVPLGGVRRVGQTVVQRTPLGQFLEQTPAVDVEGPFDIGLTDAVVHTYVAQVDEALVCAGVSASGRVTARRRVTEEDMFGGAPTVTWSDPAVIEVDPTAGAPKFVALTDFARNLMVVWPTGRIERVSLRRFSEPVTAEVASAADDAAGAVTAVSVLLGGATVLVGHADGSVGTWFVVPDEANEVDGTSLVMARRLGGNAAAVTSFASSARQRMFLAGHADGTAQAWFVTSEKNLGRLETGAAAPIRAVAFSPKSDAVVAVSDAGAWRWGFDSRHAEASLTSLFGRVWYERYPEPTYVWQSSAGDDAFEPKLSLTPLVFGTIKATFYSMLIGLPLAILAAIYTSEFLRSRTRSAIKPAVELMASLPSVVLGFLAAMVVAPYVEANLAQVLAVVVTLPMAVLTGAYVAQAMPAKYTYYVDRYRFWLNAVAVVLGIAAAAPGGAVLESVLFAGDAKRWLDDTSVGSGLSGWIILTFPVAVVVTLWIVSSRINPLLRRIGAAWSFERAAVMHLVKFGIATVLCGIVTVLIAAAIYWLPALAGGAPWDVRGGVEIAGVDVSPLQTFDTRNALVVGFMMGFAIIPIMYTIAEDALSSVPSHLRAAALGAGATVWQTSWRVVVPTAMSGLFSASMVGLGRAVGETMIVLMAAGSTPVMELNAFNGFRTLSANIATELPEAVRGSTHYKALFLAALVLFAMTFVINTIAEFVRLRFRKRAFQL